MIDNIMRNKIVQEQRMVKIVIETHLSLNQFKFK